MIAIPDVEICTSPQGSKAWKADRAGVISGSNFKLVMERIKSGPNKGDYKADAKKYANELAFERSTGEVLDDNKYETPYMLRGTTLEEDARAAHGYRIGQIPEEAGFIRTTDRRFGVSVDALLRPDGGAEYKCFTEANKVADVLIRNDTSEVMAQVQGAMWITNRKWWHYGLFHPALISLGMRIKLIEMERDNTYIEELEHNLIHFDRYVTDIANQIIEASKRTQFLKYPGEEKAEPKAKAKPSLANAF